MSAQSSAELERRQAKYLRQPDGSYKCRDCGEVILAARVAHPIWDGPFPMSGSGKCEYENVPYCPKCEKKPSFHGAPIKRSRADDLW